MTNDFRGAAVDLGERHPLWNRMYHDEGMQAVCDDSDVAPNVTMNLSDKEVQRVGPGTKRKSGLISMQGGYCWLYDDAVAAFDAPYSPNIGIGGGQALPFNAEEMTKANQLILFLTTCNTSGVVIDFQRLARIVAAATRRVRGLDGLAVHDACRGLGLAPRLLAVKHQGEAMDGLEQHPAHKAAEPPTHRLLCQLR